MQANVSSEELKRQINQLTESIDKLDAARKKLLSDCQRASSDWDDKKYQRLESIVNESTSTLMQIEKGLLQNQKKLAELYKIVNEYESTGLYSSPTSVGQSSGDSEGSFSSNQEELEAMFEDSSASEESDGGEGDNHLHITPEEEQNLYKSGLQDINEMIVNYREALMENGVPNCPWLEKTLAEHKMAMKEQLGYDLDVASGNANISENRPDAYPNVEDYNAFYQELTEQFREYCRTGTNPNYAPHTSYADNCQRCVPTCEARRRGMEVEAYPSTHGSEHLSYHPYDIWENPEIHTTSGSGMEDICRTMAEWGDGVRVQVVCVWQGPFSDGHTFYAEQINGRTVFTDPQTGNSDFADRFELMAEGRTTFCRIDNQEFSSYARECFFGR